VNSPPITTTLPDEPARPHTIEALTTRPASLLLALQLGAPYPDITAVGLADNRVSCAITSRCHGCGNTNGPYSNAE
jgi:hypothetical protein